MLNTLKSIKEFILLYPTPSNLGLSWNFGVASFFFLVAQIVTGFFLSMYYIASPEFAFNSVENIMRNVGGGYLMKYLHSNGASFFFICVYLHMARSIYFKSFLAPRIAV